MLPPKLPSDVSQSRILKALRKSGFILNWSGGKGSHCKAMDTKSGKYILVQYHLRKGELKEILKAAEEFGYDASVIMENY